MRQVVTTENAHASGTDHAAGVRARVVRQRRLAGDQFAVVGRADLDLDVRAGRGSGGLEAGGAVHRHLDRAAALATEDRRDRLQVDRDLAAEAAADFARRDRHAGERHLQQFGRLLPGGERTLCAGPQPQRLVFAPQRGRNVRLDVALMHAGGLEFAFHNEVGRREAFRDVAFLEVQMRCDVGRPVALLAHRIGTELLVQQRGVVLHGVEHVGDRRQRFVFDLDLGGRFFGRVGVDRGDRRHGVTFIQHLVAGHAVGGKVGQVDGAFAEVGDLVRQIGPIRPRRHGQHAGRRLRRAGVDRLDPRVRMRAAEHLAVNQPRQLQVRPIDRPPGHLIGAVVTNRSRADDFVISRFGVLRHDQSGSLLELDLNTKMTTVVPGSQVPLGIFGIRRSLSRGSGSRNA